MFLLSQIPFGYLSIQFVVPDWEKYPFNLFGLHDTHASEVFWPRIHELSAFSPLSSGGRLFTQKRRKNLKCLQEMTLVKVV